MAITGGITARSEALLRRVAQSVDPRAAGMRRVIAAMDKATEKLAQEARNGWPVDRNTKGNPTRKKAGQKHSVDLIEVRTVLHPTRIVATVYNTATYGYYIRSVMVGETTAEQRRRHIWRDGVPQDRYEAQRRVGRKRHAFSVLFRRPGRKAGRLLAKNLQNELVDLLRKEL
jgi:hypothetical protein